MSGGSSGGSTNIISNGPTFISSRGESALVASTSTQKGEKVAVCVIMLMTMMMNKEMIVMIVIVMRMLILFKGFSLKLQQVE